MMSILTIQRAAKLCGVGLTKRERLARDIRMARAACKSHSDGFATFAAWGLTELCGNELGSALKAKQRLIKLRETAHVTPRNAK